MRRNLCEDNSITSCQKKILKEQSNFYRKLYSSNPEIKFQLENTSELVVEPDDREQINQPITIEEMGLASRKLSSGKTPGCDGLQPEWYKFFWVKVRNMFYEAYIYALKIGKLHLSGRRGVITLIPKIHRNPVHFKELETDNVA